jgi:hypothetical protein
MQWDWSSSFCCCSRCCWPSIILLKPLIRCVSCLGRLIGLVLGVVTHHVNYVRPTFQYQLCNKVVRKENEANHMKKVHKDDSSGSEYQVEKVLLYRIEMGVETVKKRKYAVSELTINTWSPIIKYRIPIGLETRKKILTRWLQVTSSRRLKTNIPQRLPHYHH